MKKVIAIFKDELYHLFYEGGSPARIGGFFSHAEVCEYCDAKKLALIKTVGLDEDFAWCCNCKMDVEFDDHGNCKECGNFIM